MCVTIIIICRHDVWLRGCMTATGSVHGLQYPWAYVVSLLHTLIGIYFIDWFLGMRYYTYYCKYPFSQPSLSFHECNKQTRVIYMRAFVKRAFHTRRHGFFIGLIYFRVDGAVEAVPLPCHRLRCTTNASKYRYVVSQAQEGL